uniref:Uncharacterized protein n=1 Tax=Siphoviridae sp. ctx254 TaxID=2825737 RepID=A0A8S5TVR6_9CAUD|nr:MAG TPA: hypothetical protein [Siphoviridae sp. ctx254]
MPFCPKTHFYFYLHYKKIKILYIVKRKKWASGQRPKFTKSSRRKTCKNPTSVVYSR